MSAAVDIPPIFVVTDLDRDVERGDNVFFDVPANPFFESELIRRVAGMPGDAVTFDDREVFVDGESQGVAKYNTKSGAPLTVLNVEIIPDGFVYLAGDVPDSFDSRYEEFGLFPINGIKGLAVEQ